MEEKGRRGERKQGEIKGEKKNEDWQKRANDRNHKMCSSSVLRGNL